MASVHLPSIFTSELDRYAACPAAFGREQDMRSFVVANGLKEPAARRIDEGLRGILAAVPAKANDTSIAVEEAADNANILLTFGDARQLAEIAALRNEEIARFLREHEGVATVNLSEAILRGVLEFPNGVYQPLVGNVETSVSIKSADGSVAVLHIESGLRDDYSLRTKDGELRKEYVGNAALERLADKHVDFVRVVVLGRGATGMGVADYHDFDTEGLDAAIESTVSTMSASLKAIATRRLATTEKQGDHCQKCFGRGCCVKLKQESRLFTAKEGEIAEAIQKRERKIDIKLEDDDAMRQEKKTVLGAAILALEKHRDLMNRVLWRGELLADLQKQVTADKTLGSENFMVVPGRTFFRLGAISERGIREGVESLVGEMDDLEWLQESRELKVSAVRDYVARHTGKNETEVVPYLIETLGEKSPLTLRRDVPKVKVEVRGRVAGISEIPVDDTPPTLRELELETFYFYEEQKKSSNDFSDSIKDIHERLGHLQQGYVERWEVLKVVPGVELERGRNVAIWDRAFVDASTAAVGKALAPAVSDYDPNEFATESGTITAAALANLVARKLGLLGKKGIEEAKQKLIKAGVARIVVGEDSLKIAVPKEAETVTKKAKTGGVKI